jgi:hypothetical protein
MAACGRIPSSEPFQEKQRYKEETWGNSEVNAVL